MRVARPGAALWPGAIIALAAAVGGGLLLMQLLMSPPRRELAEVAAYLSIAGVVTIGVAWAAARIVGQASALDLRAKTLIGSLAGVVIALVNVFIMAGLMFVSTEHDLPLLVALLVFGGVISAFTTMWVTSGVTARTAAINDALRRLGAGSYDVSLPAGGRDEVASLARDVNRLARRLEDAERERDTVERQRRELTAAISHDLRTPLSSIRAMLEALDDRVVHDASEVARYHAALRHEVTRIDRMIDDLFELSRIDAGALRLELRPVAVDEILAEVADSMRARAQAEGIAVELDTNGAAAVALVDGDRIERALSNLVQNAIEHTPAGGSISLRATICPGHVEVSVADTGTGIPGEDLPHIWQRFYRADRSRNRDHTPDGAGLGLAIVRGIVEAHGGSVSVESAPAQGTVFTMRLPRHPDG